MDRDSNIGQVGVESIRLNGRRIDDLPPHQSRVAQLQLPVALEAEKRQKIENILAAYPRTTREYLEARLRECKAAIEDFKRVKKDKRTAISTLVELGQAQKGPSFRDVEQELYEIGQRTDLTFEERRALIAEKRAGCSAYDQVSLARQVTQYQEDIERLDDAIEAEQNSVAELRETLGKIAVRDAELKALGVTEIQ